MADLRRQARTALAGLVMAGMTSGVAFGYPDEREKPKNDLGAVLENVPPEIRQKLKAEIEKVRAEAEKVRNEAMEAQKAARTRMEQMEREIRGQAERVQRDAKQQIERIQNDVRRQMEARERERYADREAQAKKAHGDVEPQRNEVRREMRVEVRKDGDGEPKVQIFENGKPVDPNTVDVRGRMNGLAFVPEMDLSKLPPEKREAIEKARKEFKEAQVRMKEAAEKLAKTEGREQRNVIIMTDVTAHGDVGHILPQIQVQGVPIQPGAMMRGDRLPGMPIPPGVVVQGDRLPRPPLPPINPELEKRVSKAEKALDDILNELKKLREEEEDEDEAEKPGKEKAKKPKKG